MLAMEHITFDDAPLSRTVPVVPMPFGPPPTSAAASAGEPPPLFWSEEEAADLLPMHDALTCVRALERAVGNLPIARREAIGPCHSVRIPEVSLVKYVEHVVTTCDYGAVGVAIGIALLGRYSLCADQPLDGHMLHRAFLTAMQIGMKTGDFFIKNVFYAQVCGLQLAELNAQERYLLAAMQHRAIPTWSEMVALPKAILAMSEDGLTHKTINALFVQHCMLLDSSASSRVPTPGNSCLGLAPSESLTSLLLPPLVGTPSEASSSLSNGVSSEFFAPPAVTQ